MLMCLTLWSFMLKVSLNADMTSWAPWNDRGFIEISSFSKTECAFFLMDSPMAWQKRGPSLLSLR